MLSRAPWALVFLIASSGCGPKDDVDGGSVRLRSERDEWGLITCSESTPDRTCYTHRALLGVSMGASGAGQIGFSRPELFDTVAMLGIPLLDWVYMLRNFRHYYLGGFCDRATILANLDKVNDPNGPAFCGPVNGVERLEPTGKLIEADQDFNHWYRWIDEGRGGRFGRNKLRESFQDIALAFGNGLYYNPESPYYPPGVPLDYRERKDPDRCKNPPIIKGLVHKEYNPDGKYDVIPVCDTATNEGTFDPMRPNEVGFEMLIAVDYNGNGRRDFAEPVLVMAHERFEDTGSKPNDAYDWATNPTGTAGNWLHDEGEPYEDTGLDGVPGTNDFGEGNGTFDYSPNILNYFRLNPRMLIEQMPAGHLDRLHIWADAGIRDFLMSAAGTNWFWGALRHRTSAETARDYTSFKSFAGGVVDYDFSAVDYAPEAIGKHVYVRYGDPEAPEREVKRGDGHHVGPADQVINRFLTALAFAQARLHQRDVRQIDDVGDVDTKIKNKSYYSEILGEERPFGIVLPPGYDPADTDTRYPVMYFLHGQGMESESMLASGLFAFGYMAGSNDPEKRRARKSDWAKFILVFPDSRCRRGECDGGNFNTNHPGLDGKGPRFMDALFELMAHIEQSYNVAIPVEVPR